MPGTSPILEHMCEFGKGDRARGGVDRGERQTSEFLENSEVLEVEASRGGTGSFLAHFWFAQTSSRIPRFLLYN